MLTSLTSQDLKNIGKVVEKVVDGELEEKLSPLYEFKDQALEMLENIFDDLQGKHEKEINLDKRVNKLEQIHPDNSHQSAIL